MGKKAREPRRIAKDARRLRGIKAKIFSKKRYTEKATMKKTIKAHQEKDAKVKDADEAKPGAVPSYLLDREQVRRTKVLSNMIKQKRKEKAGKWQVPIPKVKAMTEDEMFKILRTGKRKKKAWKRIVNKISFVGDTFTRKPPKFERYIRPSGLRMKKAHVTHPELKMTFFFGHRKCQEESAVTALHRTGRHHQRDDHRGERVRAGSGDADRQGCLGQVRPGHKQPRDGRLHQCAVARVRGI